MSDKADFERPARTFNCKSKCKYYALYTLTNGLFILQIHRAFHCKGKHSAPQSGLPLTDGGTERLCPALSSEPVEKALDDLHYFKAKVGLL